MAKTIKQEKINVNIRINKELKQDLIKISEFEGFFYQTLIKKVLFDYVKKYKLDNNIE